MIRPKALSGCVLYVDKSVKCEEAAWLLLQKGAYFIWHSGPNPQGKELPLLRDGEHHLHEGLHQIRTFAAAIDRWWRSSRSV